MGKFEDGYIKNGTPNEYLILAMLSSENGWCEKPASQDIRILKKCGGKIALELSIRSDKNGFGKTKIAKCPRLRALCKGKVGRELERRGFFIKKKSHIPKKRLVRRKTRKIIGENNKKRIVRRKTKKKKKIKKRVKKGTKNE